MPLTLRLHRRLPLTYVLGFASLMTFLLSSAPAHSEWVKVSSAQSYGSYSTYVDPDTLRRKGELVKLWELNDYKTIQTDGSNSFLSLKSQSEFDCAEERIRLLAATEFSGNMGKGQVVSSSHFGEGGWAPVQPDSVGEIVWKLVCDKP